MATAVSNRNGLWFGTVAKSQWFRTPLSGADSSPQAWGSSGTDLNGQGYSLGSWGSHKVYSYEWSGASARKTAQLMKSYADGTYGRGLVYFQDPLTFDTNVLTARLADPSMAIGYEGTSLVYGVQPTGTPTGANTNDLPVTSAVYNLGTTPNGFRGTQQAIYVPIPDGHTLFLGAFYSSSGTGGVYVSPQNTNGTIGAYVKLTELSSNSANVVQDSFSGISGVWIWVGRTASTAATVTLRGMIGRLLDTNQTVPPTNPHLAKIKQGPWIGGQGNAGCRFEGKPTYIEYNGVGGGQVGFAATFREVG